MTDHELDDPRAPERGEAYSSILRVFEAAIDLPLAADETYRRLRAQGSNIGPATFYRALTTLKEAGLLRSIRQASGDVAYEIDDVRSHDRLICTLCGRVHAFDDKELHLCRQRIAARYGFDVVGTTHVIYAHCLRSDCAHFQRRTLTLM